MNEETMGENDEVQIEYEEEEQSDTDEPYTYVEEEEEDDDDNIYQSVHYSSEKNYYAGSKFNYFLKDIPSASSHQLTIFKFLEDMIKKTEKRVELEWDIQHPVLFYRPTLTIAPSYDEDCMHIIRMLFKTNFPDSSFILIPQQSYPPRVFFSIYFHPFLSKSKWNPFRDWAPVLTHMITKISKTQPTDWIAGGDPSIFGSMYNELAPLNDLLQENRTFSTATKSSAFNTYYDRLPLEFLILMWYTRCQAELPFESWCEGNLFEDMESEIQGIPAVKKDYKPFQGVGYLTSSRTNDSRPALELNPSKQYLLDAIEQRIAANVSSEAVGKWLLSSPLLAIIILSLTEFHGYYPHHNRNEWFLLFKMLAYFETLATKMGKTAANFPLENIRKIFNSFCVHHQPDIAAGIQNESLDEICRLSDICRTIFEAQNRQPDAISIPLTASESAVVDGFEGLNFDANKRVYMEVENILNVYSGQCRSSTNSTGNLSARAKSNILREIKFLDRELIPQITLFISKESLQYMMFVITIDQPDNPYYGGIYVFYMQLPDDYPASAPTVKFITTGGGQVRFNPNLYADGKVCLSLLGTWSGPAWDPATSNIYQLVNSIYGLIFTEDPLFNEPGYEKDRSKYSKESNAYTMEVRRNVLSTALCFHVKHPCPVLHSWILGCVQYLWPQCRGWFYSHQAKFGFSTESLAFLDLECLPQK